MIPDINLVTVLIIHANNIQQDYWINPVMSVMTMEMGTTHLTTCRIQPPIHTSTTTMQDPSPVGSPPVSDSSRDGKNWEEEIGERRRRNKR